MREKITDRTLFFGLTLAFILTCAALIILFPEGQSFFVINGMHHPVTDTFFTWFTYVGDGLTVGIVAFLLMMFYRVNAGIMVGLGLGLCGITVSVLKNFIFTESLRPKLALWEKRHMIHEVEGIYINIDHSFPSGHSLTVFFCFTFLALLKFGNSGFNQILFALAAILAAYSRVYLAHHFVGDILAGACAGILLGILMYTLYGKAKMKKWLNQPAWTYFKK